MTYLGTSFSGCSSLASIVFLSDKTEISDGNEYAEFATFAGCVSLTVYCPENSPIPESLDNKKFLYEMSNGKPVPYKILGKDSLADSDNGVILENSNLSGTSLTVTVADPDSKEKVTYNITIKDKDGKEIQPEGDVTVKIPLPEGWDGAKTIVSRHETDGTYTNMKAKFENGYMVFVTEHFSEYVLSLEELEPDSPADNTTSTDDTTDPDNTTSTDDTTDPDVTTSTDDTTASENGNASNSNGNNPATGFAIAIVPVIAASAAAVVFGKKRR